MVSETMRRGGLEGQTVEDGLETEGDELCACESEGHCSEGCRGEGGEGHRAKERVYSASYVPRACERCQSRSRNPFFHERAPFLARVSQNNIHLAILVHPHLKGNIIIFTLIVAYQIRKSSSIEAQRHSHDPRRLRVRVPVGPQNTRRYVTRERKEMDNPFIRFRPSQIVYAA